MCVCVCVALYKVYHLIFHHFVLSDAVSQAGRISKQGIISMCPGSKVLNSDRLGARCIELLSRYAILMPARRFKIQTLWAARE